jgi:hypothetical protein
VNELTGTFSFVEVENDADENRRSTAKENASRNAQVEVTYNQTGTGQKRVKEAIIFPVIFKNEPHFTSGSGVVSNPNSDVYHDPRGSSGVYAWKRDGRGYYTGAWVWVRIDMERKPISTRTGQGASRQYMYQLLAGQLHTKVTHFLTFSAIAFKDLPTNTLSPALTPRTVGF